MKYTGAIFSFMLLGFLAGPALGSPPVPVPTSKTQALEQLQTRLKAEEEHKEELETELKDLTGKLEETKAELVKATESVQANEKLLLSLQARMAAMEEEKSDLAERLEKDQASMAELVLALNRIRRVPPEALIVRPGAPLKTAQSALLLKHILPPLYQRAARLSTNLQRLDEVTASLKQDQQKAQTTQAILQVKYNETKKLVEERRRLHKKLNRGYELTVSNIERISREADSLQDLLTQLEEEQKKQAQAAKTRKQIYPGKKPLLTRYAPKAPVPDSGAPRLPVSGVILTRFGDKDNIGASSQGLSIKGQPKGLVVAPMGAVVRYAGPFKNYGQLVVLEHKDNYHSLIGGMAGINVTIGQKVEAGEPVGELPSGPSPNGYPTLYYELRHRGTPINPSRKFSELKT